MVNSERTEEQTEGKQLASEGHKLLMQVGRSSKIKLEWKTGERRGLYQY
jgi:hypothetical protein